MTRITKLDLARDNEALRTRIAVLEAQLELMQRKAAAPVRAAVPASQAPRARGAVYEFNPALPGDFMRATKLAREFNGSVRRAMQ